MLMLSDIWHSKGYIFEEKINVFQIVFYQHVWTKEEDLAGVIVDYELDDDFHYELTSENWLQFSNNVLTPSMPERNAFSLFIEKHGLNTSKGLFAFETTLDDLGIQYKKIAYY